MLFLKRRALVRLKSSFVSALIKKVSAFRKFLLTSRRKSFLILVFLLPACIHNSIYARKA